jgi:hypothetical protein
MVVQHLPSIVMVLILLLLSLHGVVPTPGIMVVELVRNATLESAMTLLPPSPQIMPTVNASR